MKDQHRAGIGGQQVVQVEGRGVLIIFPADPEPHDAADFRERSVRQSPFFRIILQHDRREFQHHRFDIPGPPGGNISGNKPALAGSPQENIRDPVVIPEVIDHRVQVRRFRQHGHVQHGTAAPGVEPAAAEIQVIGGKAG